MIEITDPNLNILQIQKLQDKLPEIVFKVFSSPFTHTMTFDRVELEGIEISTLDIRAPVDEYKSYNGVYKFDHESIKKTEKRRQSGKLTIDEVIRSIVGGPNNKDLKNIILSFKFISDAQHNPVVISFPEATIMYDVFDNERAYFKATHNTIDINGEFFENKDPIQKLNQ